ncbi:MAG: tetratricopeptide repeat protein [Flavobacteriales bacterium]|nr:tetratricopeptide repeat protein [Flavobacteriales bacterium]
MNTLLAVAECYVHMAPPKGIIAAKEAEAIARSMGSDQGLSQSLGMHALGLLETGDIPEADTLLHHALAIDRKRNDTHAIAVDCIRLTIVSNARDYSTITYITEALPLLRHTSYYRELASAHFWTNIEYSSVDGYILHLDTAKYLFEQVGDSSGIAQCLDMQMRFLPVANDAALAKAYMRNALRMARSVDDHALEARLLANSCAHALNASDYAGALLAGLDAINIAGAAGCTVTRDQSMGNVATVYEELGDPASALPYYRQILAGARRSGAKSDLANSYASLGSAFLSLGDLDSALYWNEQLEELSRTFASQAGYAEVGLGKVYAARKEWSLALDHLMKATAPTKELDDYFELALDIELDMARVLLHADEQSLRTHGFIPAQRWAQARVHLQKVLAMASAREFMKYKQEALYELSRIAEHDGDVAGAYALHKRYSAVKDSVLDTDKAKAVALLQIKYETEKKEEQIVLLGKDKEVQVKEIQKQKLMRNGFMGGFALVALFAGVFFFQRNRISKARKLSDELLLNILPEEVAEELKAMGSADAQLIDQVTVLFTDFKGFTAMSELLTPKELVARHPRMLQRL